MKKAIVKNKTKKPLLVRLQFGKEAISIRLDADVLSFFRKSGERWQSRINEILKQFIADERGHNR